MVEKMGIYKRIVKNIQYWNFEMKNIVIIKKKSTEEGVSSHLNFKYI